MCLRNLGGPMDEKDEEEAKNRFPQARRSYGGGVWFGAEVASGGF
jgi:hypothetical protein